MHRNIYLGGIFLLLVFLTSFSPDPMPCHIIRYVPKIHCQRGPERCAKCKAEYSESYALLDVCPQGDYARPVIGVEVEGKTLWRTYDVLKRFDRLQDALIYAREQKIADVKLEEGFWKEDKKLMEVEKKLPKGWRFAAEKNCLKLYGLDTIKVLTENLINAPLPVLNTREMRAEAEGVKTIPYILLEVQDLSNKTSHISSLFALQWKEAVGLQDEMHSVSPASASETVFRVQQLLKEMLK